MKNELQRELDDNKDYHLLSEKVLLFMHAESEKMILDIRKANDELERKSWVIMSLSISLVSGLVIYLANSINNSALELDISKMNLVKTFFTISSVGIISFLSVAIYYSYITGTKSRVKANGLEPLYMKDIISGVECNEMQLKYLIGNRVRNIQRHIIFYKDINAKKSKKFTISISMLTYSALYFVFAIILILFLYLCLCLY